MKRMLLTTLILISGALLYSADKPAELLPTGNLDKNTPAARVELFTDDFVIEKLGGDARKVLQKPEPREVVLTTDAPWEGNTCGYYTVFQDCDKYRIYYRGSAAKPKTKNSSEPMVVNDKGVWVESKDPNPKRPEVTCLAESADGIHWTKPKLNLFDWEASKENNIVWTGPLSHNMAVFKDGNPAAPEEARYKAVARSGGPYALQSADGIRWKVVSEKALVADGTFDSQNLAFWDSVRQEYRLYWRINPKSVRGIRTATSKDFVNWKGEHKDLVYPGSPVATEWKNEVQLYTNAVQPYFRAPHLFVGFPTQFLHRGYQTQPLFMSSRDGVEFIRWDEPVIPTTAPENRDGNRSNYMAWGMVQLPGKPDEISVYASENYYGTGPTRLRRFVYRLDGFVSVSAGADGGELLTKPLFFAGNDLTVNYKVKEGGMIRVELIDVENGKAVKGFGLEDCEPMTGDSVNAVVRWKGNPVLKDAVTQKAVRIRFALKKADLYSIKI